MSADPSLIECPFDITVPGPTGLMLRCWEIRLNNRPDARQGELPKRTLPDGVDAGYVAVVWEGTIDIDGVQYGADSCESRVANVAAGQVISLADGTERARLAVLGVDDEILPIGPLARGAHPFLDVGDPSQAVTFILRILDFSVVTDPVALEAWGRPGFLLSTIDGPGFGQRKPPGNAQISELDFVLLAPGSPYVIGPGTAGENLAMVLDYYVLGDPADPRQDGGVEGCKIRCWGGGIED